MVDLFSPLSISGKELPNRIVMGPAPSGFASADGFVSDALAEHYGRRARGGVGLLFTEPLLVVPPDEGASHVGIYDDAFVPGLRRIAAAVHPHGARLLLTLDAPPPAGALGIADLADLSERFIIAAWRAHAAGADGIMLSTADGGLLHHLVSPLHNQRNDIYGASLGGRLRMPLEIVEGVRAWLGRRLIVGFRLLAEEFVPGGMGLQDARVVAKRVTAAGVRLLDVTVAERVPSTLARFPGWAVPLANGIKRVIPDVPVIGSGLLGDPQLADSVVRDGSVDLVMLRHALHTNPDWPMDARAALAQLHAAEP